MDTQTAPAHTTDVVHSAVEGAEEEHQAKSPVFKKMKDKVRKIKNTINKKVHDQAGRQQHGDLDEGDDVHEDDEEMLDPEIHGAPIYESSAQDRPNAVGGTDESSDARGRVATAQDRPNVVKGPDESTDALAKVRTGQDRPNAVKVTDESSDARMGVRTAQDRRNGVGGRDEISDARARVGAAQDRPNQIEGHEGDGAVGLGLITAELAEDPAAPKTSSTEAATAQEQNRAGEEVEVSPELCRSFEAMAVSNQAQAQPEDRAEVQLSKDKNSGYTEKISSAKDATVSAASKVYEKVAGAGTAVMAKVKPEAGKDGGEHENMGKTQDKGVSMKDYLAEKLTPGEDEKALSAAITEAVQKKKNAAPVSPPPPREVTGSGEAGGGMGMVGKMRETVTSFLGGGGSSPKSPPATESPAKVADDTKDFHSRPTEAVSPGEDDKAPAIAETVQKLDAGPVTPPPREVTGSGEAGGGMSMVGKIRETVTSFLGGGGSSPKSAPATESPAKVAEDTKHLHSRPTDAVSQEKDLE